MPVSLLLLIVASATSIIGAICGIGGGVLIKPILDAMGVMSVSAVSFISGCTVLAMALSSVGSSIYKKTARINKRTTPALGVGAAIGGIIGKSLFGYVKQAAGSEAAAGLVQAVLLGLVITGTLVYLLNKDKVKSYRVTSVTLSAIIGLMLGTFSTFVGIGGGPTNIAVLSLFYSTDMKESATNSLCVILISQAASLLIAFATSAVPDINALYLTAMVAGGVAGGLIGQRAGHRISEKQLKTLFNALMVVVICICIYNAVRFALAM